MEKLAGKMPPAGGDATKDKSVEGVGRRRRQANLKLWLRNLTPGISEEQLKELFESILATNASASMDWLRLVPASKQVPTATAYLHFKSEEALHAMHTKLDGYKLFDAKGKEFKVLAEYAPYQKIPRKKVIDRREGTIEKDPDYMAFIEEFEQQRSFKIESAEAWLERREQEAAAKAAAGTDGTDKAIFVSTPLLDYVREKRERSLREKRDQRVREDERRRKMQTEALMRAKAQQQQQLLQQQQQQQHQQQQQRGAVSARGGRGSRGGGPAAQGPAAVVPQAIAVRPTSAGSRPASAGSSRLGEGQKGAAREVQRNSGGGGRGPGVPSSDESQAQQGRGGSKESKHSSQSEGKGNASASSQQFHAQQILQRETQVQSQRPSSSAQEPPSRANPVARGGGGGRSAGAGPSAGGIARAGGAGGGGSSSSGISGGGQTEGGAPGEGKSEKSKTSARPVGVYRPRPRGGGSGGES